MEIAGWSIDSDMIQNDDFYKGCATGAHYGVKNFVTGKHGKDNENTGAVFATFKGQGTASIIFGNCYYGDINDGYVRTTLNNQELGSRSKNVKTN